MTSVHTVFSPRNSQIKQNSRNASRAYCLVIILITLCDEKTREDQWVLFAFNLVRPSAQSPMVNLCSSVGDKDCMKG